MILGLAITLSAAAQTQASAEAELAQAMRLIGQGEFAQAEQKLRAIEKAHPGLFEVRYRLGLVLMRQGKLQEASPRLEAAVQQAPSSAAAWLAAAQVRLKLEKRESALAAAKRASELAPQEPMMWRTLSRFYSDAGEFPHALEFEEKFAAAKGETAELYLVRGLAYRAAGKPADAVNALQEAIRLAPQNWPAYAALAALFLDHRTPEPVVALLQAAPKPFTNIAEYHRMLGLAYYQTGKRDQAIDEFLAAVDLEPNSELGYTSLETLLPDAGPRRAELIRRFERLRSTQPKNSIGYFLLARGLALNGAPPERVEPLLRRAILVEPKFWPAYHELGLMLETQGNTGEAVRMQERVAKLKHDHAPAHFALSRLYAKQGNRTLAVAHRKRHAELLEREREAAARARQANPALNYRLESGAGIASPRNER